MQQEETIQKLLEIKIQNKGIERANRLTEITKRMSIEEQRLNMQEAEFTNAQYSMKLERKAYQENQVKSSDKDLDESKVMQEKLADGKKKTKTVRRAERETEERLTRKEQRN